MNKIPSTRTILLLVALAIVGLLFTTPALAQGKQFRWLNWESDITLLDNGQLQVEETHTLDFQGEPFTFGYRTIRTGSSGGNDGLRDIAVREGDLIYERSSSGAPGTFTVSEEGDEVTIRWYFEPALGQRTYTFSYIAEGAVITEQRDRGSVIEAMRRTGPRGKDDH